VNGIDVEFGTEERAMHSLDDTAFERLLWDVLASHLTDEGNVLPMPAVVQRVSQSRYGKKEGLCQNLMATTTVDDVLRECIEVALSSPDIIWGAGYVVDERTGALELVVEEQVPPATLPNILCYAEKSKLSLHVRDGHPVYLVRTGDRADDVYSLAILPITYNNRAVACLTLASDSQAGISRSTRSAIEEIAAYGSIVIARISIEERLEGIRHKQEEALTSLIHSLKTPLALMQGYIELLVSLPKDEGESSRRQAILKKIMSRGERVSAFITDLLQLEAMDAGEIHTEDEAFSLGSLLEEIVKNHEPPEDMNRIALTVSNKEDVIVADRALIVHAFLHLITNAIKFSSERILLKADTTDDLVVVELLDRGVGMTADELPHIFDRFYHSPFLPSGRPNSGAGLGLTVAKRIVEHYNGELSVSSDSGQGSRFCVSLPRAG